KSQKHSFVILSDSEESDIIEILCRSAPQNDTAWTIYEFIKIVSATLLLQSRVTNKGQPVAINMPTLP
ncbi:MAG: hypothetical protein J7J07_03785, partial [Syntrophobacterales bacterium]|nr:hypothetical protein [Syntrophobacterales bacterium]